MDSISGEAESAREWADRMYERLEYVPHHILARAFVVELTANGGEQKARERLAWLEDQTKALNDNGIDETTGAGIHGFLEHDAHE